MFSTKSFRYSTTKYFLALFFFLLCTPTQLLAQISDTHWVTTWSASPSSLPTQGPSSDAASQATEEFNQQTLRQIIHSSAGGNHLRIRLSNVHGNKPLEIGAANIALQINNDEIDDKSLRDLTFGQQKSVIIPRGAVAFSDPVEMAVPQLSNLSVSLYLPKATGPSTHHRNANQQSWLANGNQAQSKKMTDAKAIASWYYLVAVDVLSSDKISTIVTVGDSITDGYGSTIDSNNRWPNHLAKRLSDSRGNLRFAVSNAGISGNRVLSEQLPFFGENLQARFERDVLALSGVSHIVVLEGINDIGMASRLDKKIAPEELIAGYRQIIARAHARNIKVIGATLLPYQGAAYYSEEGEETRLAVNEWIRNSGEYDGVIDFEKATRDPQNPQSMREAITSDNLHPNDMGYKDMAEIIELSLFE